MSNTLTIAWKETRTYFATPVAYVVAAMFLVFTGIFFVNDMVGQFPEATVRGYVTPARLFFVFLGPLLTMRLLAEEQKLGTLELLLTAPIRDWEVVAGKYLASLVILAATLSLSLYYVFLLYYYASPDTGPVMTAYLGLLLYGATSLAAGLLASSLTSNQIVAAVVGIGILLPLSFLEVVSSGVSGTAVDVVRGMSMAAHFDDFPRGVLDTSNVVYFLSLAAVFLFLAVQSLESRRWR